MPQGDLRSVVQRMIDAGESEDNIRLVIESLSRTPTAQPKMGMMEALMAGETATADPQVIEQQGRIIGRIAPIAGGLAGGALGTLAGGPVGGVAGAGAGTAAGEAVNRSLNREPISAGNLAMAGASGAAGQALGPLLGKGIQKAGRFIGRGAVAAGVRPSAAVRREFGGHRGVADTILDEKLMTSRGANRATQRSSDAVRAELAKNADAPNVQADELLDDINPVLESASKQAKLGKVDQTDAILDRLAAIERRNPGGMRLEAAHDLKGEAQSLASGAYKARALGNEPGGLGAETDEAIAKGLRRAIETRAPNVAQGNQRTQRLIGARRALQEAEDRPHNLTNTLAMMTGAGGIMSGNLPAAAMGAAAVRGIAVPRVGIGAGIAADQAGKALGNPELVKAALLAALLGQEQ